MSATVEIRLDRFPEIAAMVKRNGGAIVRKLAFDYLGELRESFGESKSGRTYTRGSRTHQASAPGEPPAIDTGLYTNSWQVEMEAPTTAVVFTNVEYGPALEFGGAKMAARPHAVPALERIRKPFLEALRSDLLPIK